MVSRQNRGIGALLTSLHIGGDDRNSNRHRECEKSWPKSHLNLNNTASMDAPRIAPKRPTPVIQFVAVCSHAFRSGSSRPPSPSRQCWTS